MVYRIWEAAYITDSFIHLKVPKVGNKPTTITMTTEVATGHSSGLELLFLKTRVESDGKGVSSLHMIFVSLVLLSRKSFFLTPGVEFCSVSTLSSISCYVLLRMIRPLG